MARRGRRALTVRRGCSLRRGDRKRTCSYVEVALRHCRGPTRTRSPRSWVAAQPRSVSRCWGAATVGGQVVAAPRGERRRPRRPRRRAARAPRRGCAARAPRTELPIDNAHHRRGGPRLPRRRGRRRRGDGPRRTRPQGDTGGARGGKSVVTANKALIAVDGRAGRGRRHLRRRAGRRGRGGGAIPVLRPLTGVARR